MNRTLKIGSRLGYLAGSLLGFSALATIPHPSLVEEAATVVSILLVVRWGIGISVMMREDARR